MCGIAGWVDFARDLKEEQPTLQAMIDTLAPRGVDDQGVWTAGHVGLGHTRTAIIDVAGGRQPLVAERDGRVAGVISYNGEVYNFKQLRSELRERGHRFETRSDTEVVLRAYLEWGTGCAQRLEGIFAFAIWDPRSERLVLVRDRLGIKPLFYSRTADGVVFGSEPKALLAHPLVSPTVTMEGLREVFSIAKQPGKAVFRDMSEVLPGHVLTISRAGVVDTSYWTLEARPHTDSLEQTITRVRSLLDEIVLRELVADVPLCTMLSGGLDSSAVSAVAARWRWQLDGERIQTFVTTFDGYAKNFQPDDTRTAADEPYAIEVAERLRSDHVNIVLSTADLMTPATRMAALVAQDLPSTLGDMDTSNYLTAQRIKKQSTVALSGEVADEVFGGYGWMFNPDCVAGDVFPWVVSEMRQPGTSGGQGRGLFDRGLLERLDMRTYYSDGYRTACREAPHPGGESPEEHRMRSICYAALTRWLPMLLARDDRLSMAHGLELRVPYADHRLVEYLYNTPWSFKTFDDREKGLLRAAVRNLLPASVLDRRKSPWPVTQDQAYTRMLHDELRALIGDANAPVLPLLDAGAVLRTLDRPAHDWPSRMNIEMALQFNTWLTHYDVELTV
jgi:asparagine synthase (glutamine-hydrolysing)